MSNACEPTEECREVNGVTGCYPKGRGIALSLYESEDLDPVLYAVLPNFFSIQKTFVSRRLFDLLQPVLHHSLLTQDPILISM